MKRFIKYKNIVRDRYTIDNYGNIYDEVMLREIIPCKPSQNKGYSRVHLKTIEGKYKKFSVHSLVCKAYKPFRNISYNEINHIDGNKLNNHISNLEYCDRKLNAKHARDNGLYKTCEESPRSIFTKSEVIKICKLLEKGHNINYILEKMNYTNPQYRAYICSIKNRESWVDLTSKYSWDINAINYKTYEYDHICDFCDMITRGYTNKEISEKYKDLYDTKKLKNCLKKIKEGKLYKKIAKQYFK